MAVHRRCYFGFLGEDLPGISNDVTAPELAAVVFELEAVLGRARVVTFGVYGAIFFLLVFGDFEVPVAPTPVEEMPGTVAAVAAAFT
jgi:hypothetical protein